MGQVRGLPIVAPALAIASRVLAVLMGGYAATVGVVALIAVLLPRISGMARSEAVVLASMLGFLVYTAIIIWAVAERRVWRVWAVLGGVALASHGLAIGLAAL